MQFRFGNPFVFFKIHVTHLDGVINPLFDLVTQ